MSDVRSRILDAAVEAAAVHGIARLSVADVARRAGLSRPTVYKHFGSKDDLVAAAVQREAVAMAAAVLAAVDGIDEPRRMLEVGVLTALGVARDHPLLDRVVRTEPETLVPLLTVEGSPVTIAVRQPVEHTIRRAWPHLDAVVSRRMADLLARLLVSYALSAPDDPPEVVAAVVASLLVDGVAPHVRAGRAASGGAVAPGGPVASRGPRTDIADTGHIADIADIADTADTADTGGEAG